MATTKIESQPLVGIFEQRLVFVLFVFVHGLFGL